jgi:epsilon-lactone hydrolase
MHGGGLVLLEGEGARRGALREAERLAIRTVSIDYRVPPDFPYPAALDDCLAVYQATLQDYAPQDSLIGGVSGGATSRQRSRYGFATKACRSRLGSYFSRQKSI